MPCFSFNGKSGFTRSRSEMSTGTAPEVVFLTEKVKVCSNILLISISVSLNKSYILDHSTSSCRNVATVLILYPQNTAYKQNGYY